VRRWPPLVRDVSSVRGFARASTGTKRAEFRSTRLNAILPRRATSFMTVVDALSARRPREGRRLERPAFPTYRSDLGDRQQRIVRFFNVVVCARRSHRGLPGGFSEASTNRPIARVRPEPPARTHGPFAATCRFVLARQPAALPSVSSTAVRMRCG